MTSDEIRKARVYIAEHCMDGHVSKGWRAALDEVERLQKLYEGCLTAPYAAELGKQYDEMQAEAEAWKAAAELAESELVWTRRLAPRGEWSGDCRGLSRLNGDTIKKLEAARKLDKGEG